MDDHSLSGKADNLKPRYIHGHHESVLRSHSWRTAENSAAYLLPYLKPSMTILDVGCGPGTITADLAERVAPGKLLAIDSGDDAVRVTAEEISRRNLTNTVILKADIYDPDFQSTYHESFDIVHAHQVLQHLPDPIGAMKIMRSLCKPGGLMAVRDADFGASTWFPQSDMLDKWLELYQKLARANKGEPEAGRRLLSWARLSGFENIISSASCWCFATPEDRLWWGTTWADRMTKSAVAEQAEKSAMATKEGLQAIAAAWKEWAKAPDGWYVIVSGELICRK